MISALKGQSGRIITAKTLQRSRVQSTKVKLCQSPWVTQPISKRLTWMPFLPLFWVGLGSGCAKSLRSTDLARTSYCPAFSPLMVTE
jgi:hypothetical protein